MPSYKTYFQGVIEVITGPMFSGKSAELIKRVNKLQYSKTDYIVFTSNIDTRWGVDHIKSRTGSKVKSQNITNSGEVMGFVKPSHQVVAIDEVQFFDKGIIKVIEELADQGKRVIVSGLDQDFKGNPFPVMSHLLSIAELISKETAICVKCGKQATRTYKVAGDNRKILEVGDSEYEARCRGCHKRGSDI